MYLRKSTYEEHEERDKGREKECQSDSPLKSEPDMELDP